MRTEAEVSCLPKDLPEFIEVDISGLSLNESIHLSQLKVPQDVVLVELAKEDAAVVAIHSPRTEEPEPTAAAAAVPGAGGASAAAPAAAGAGGAPAASGRAAPAKEEETQEEP